jgi:hypothetical protein
LNPKRFWYFLKTIKYSPDFPGSLSLNNVVANDGISIVNLFGIYFSSVYKNSNTSLSNYPLPVIESVDIINNCEINILGIFNELEKLTSKISTGPDGISALYLYHCRFNLTPPLHKILTLSLNIGIFPSNWKFTFINPIFKKKV